MRLIEAATPTLAWKEAVQYLWAQPDHRASRLIVEIANPIGLTSADRAVYDLVDRFLIEHGGLPVNTVTNSIFPWNLYRRYGAPAIYDEYLEMFPRIQRDPDARQWGTYFHRMIYRKDHMGRVIKPLDYLIEKLRKGLKNRSAYEMNLIDVFLDIPIYEAESDKHFPLGGPCLSHISFSLSADRRLELTALYRSHFYIQRALGNYFGLAHLLQFVAQEAGLTIGALTCISNTAQIDLKRGGWTSREVESLLIECAVAAQDAAA